MQETSTQVDRCKSTVIFQSAQELANQPKKLTRCFEVLLVGHLRAVKDPFLIVKALRSLPPSSRIKIVHMGDALTQSMKSMAERYSNELKRYRWLGPRPHRDAIRRIARSRLTVLTSKIEGAPSVFPRRSSMGFPFSVPGLMHLLACWEKTTRDCLRSETSRSWKVCCFAVKPTHGFTPVCWKKSIA